MADQADAPAAAKAPDRSGKPSVAPFLAWLAVFYIAWAACVSLVGGWGRLLDYWPIAKAMAIGSYFAGSTPMGGGTVGFPVLTLMFDYPASLGRNFALAVQSAGMVSASLFILVRRRSLDLALLRPALAGAAVGTPLGALLIAPIVPDLAVRLIFAVIWAAFGIIHWLKIGEIVTPNGPRTPHDRLDVPIGLAVGFSGGVVASVTGVGADMMLYAALVLFYRTDLKVAIPTSVILMAFTSVIGLAANCGLSAMIGGDYQIDPEVFWNWLARRAGRRARRAPGRDHRRTSAARADPFDRVHAVRRAVCLDACRPAGRRAGPGRIPNRAWRAVLALPAHAPGGA
jgi:uncharacterized membrane protein YfcA